MKERNDLENAMAVLDRHHGAVDRCPECDRVRPLDSVMQVAKGVFVMVCRFCGEARR